jgi:hypothetical protein
MFFYKNIQVYRCRLSEYQSMAGWPKTDKMFSNISELGINTPERTKSFGRANSPGNPVFYACNFPMTAVHETTQWNLDNCFRLLEKGHDVFNIHDDHDFRKVTVSQWRTTDALKGADFLNLSRGKKDLKSLDKYISDTYKVTRRELHSFKLIRKFFIDQFIKTDAITQSDYMLTAMLCDLIFEEASSNQCDAVVYSSVVDRPEGINFAISAKAIANGKLKFAEAQVRSIEDPKSSSRIGSSDNLNVWLANATCPSIETGELIWEIY